MALSIADPDNGYRYLQLRGEVENVEADPTGAFYQTPPAALPGRDERSQGPRRPRRLHHSPDGLQSTLTAFDRDTLDTLDETAEIDIETSRGEGAPVPPHHDLDRRRRRHGLRTLGPRPGRPWYRELSANPRGAVHAGTTVVPVMAPPAADPATVARVSDALNQKYRARWPGPTDSMLLEATLPTTLRLDPPA